MGCYEIKFIGEDLSDPPGWEAKAVLRDCSYLAASTPDVFLFKQTWFSWVNTVNCRSLWFSLKKKKSIVSFAKNTDFEIP